MKQLIMALVLGCLMIPSMMQAQNDTRTEPLSVKRTTRLFSAVKP